MIKNMRNLLVSIFLTCLYSSTFAAEYAYVPNIYDNTVSIFSINQSTGSLSTVDLGQKLDSKCVHPSAVEVSTSANYLYVLCKNSSTNNLPEAFLFTYQIDKSTGKLSKKPVSGGVYIPSDKKAIINLQMAMENNSSGDILYFAVSTTSGNSTLSNLLVNNSGKITTPDNFTIQQIANNVLSMAIHPINSGQNQSSVLYLETPTDIQTFSFCNNSAYSTICNKGKTIVSSNGNSNQGQLKFAPVGNFLYVVEANATPNVSEFNIDPTSGVLSNQQIISSNGTINQVTFNSNSTNLTNTDPSQNLLYAVDKNMVASYIMNLTTGTATQTSNYAISNNTTNKINADPSGKFIYVLNGNVILGYTLNSNTNGMNEINSKATGNGPSDIAFMLQ